MLSNRSNPLRMVVTHSGPFHADEVMAVALIERYLVGRPIEMAVAMNEQEIAQRMADDRAGHWDGRCLLVRTRCRGIIKAAVGRADILVIDVGERDDTHHGNFDHHQTGFSGQWPDGAGMASAGMVWHWLAKHGLLTDIPANGIDDLGEQFIKPIDMHDNGIAVCALSKLCGGYNRGDGSERQYRQFRMALDMMSGVLDNQVHACVARMTAERVLRNGWAAAEKAGSRHVLISERLEYHDCGSLLKRISGGKALLLGFVGDGSRYSLVSQKADSAFSSACPCPEEWRGRSDFRIDDGKGPVDIKFAHRSGFMVVVDGGWRAADRIARLMVEAMELRIGFSSIVGTQAGGNPARKRGGPGKA